MPVFIEKECLSVKKREIIIDGQDSDWYERAIFILKDHGHQNRPKNLFKYAEELVENSCKKGITRNSKEHMQNSFQDVFINIIFVSGIMALILSFILLIL